MLQPLNIFQLIGTAFFEALIVLQPVAAAEPQDAGPSAFVRDSSESGTQGWVSEGRVSDLDSWSNESLDIDNSPSARSFETASCLSFDAGSAIGNLGPLALAEASGLVASRQYPGVLWSHNDNSGDNRLFALNGSGSLLAVYTLSGPGVSASDPEDIAIGPGPVSGVDYIYLGDIGDNYNARTYVEVYRVPEPPVGTPAQPITAVLTGAETIRLAYPDGPCDAETLLVDPLSADIYIITKRRYDRGRVYHAPFPHSVISVTTMFFRAELPWGSVSGNGGATGGDVSADGTRILVRRYSFNVPQAASWQRSPSDELWMAFRNPGCDVALLSDTQGEAICFDSAGSGFYTVSEGVHSPLNYFPSADCAVSPDADDLCRLAFCVSGPGAGPAPPEIVLSSEDCLANFDVDQDGDVDLRDFLWFQQGYVSAQ